MNTLANSYAVSSSGGDMRGDGPMQRTPKTPQDRFANIRIVADANEEARSDSNANGEGDLGTDVRREQDALTARERDRSAAESRHAAAMIAPGNPTPLLAQTRSEAGQGDSTSERPAKAPCDESVTAESTNVEQRRQAAILSQHGKNGQHAHTTGDVARENGSFGVLAAGPYKPKGNPTAIPHALDGPSQKILSRKQSPSLMVSAKSETRLRGSGLQDQPRAGSKRGSASGNVNAATEALLSRGKETQASGHKSGASVSPGPSTCFVGQPAAAAPHTSVGAAAYGSADGGASESISQSVGDQILDSLKASMAQGDRQVLIRLQPPELGMILVRFREQGEGLDGTLRVEKTETRREIEQALPEVVRSLQDAGIGIRRLDVTSSDTLGQDVGSGQPQQNGSSGYHDASRDPESLRTSFMPRPSAAADSLADSHQVPDIQGSATLPQGRIDMLL